jgi:hypothetical protein
MEGAGAKGPSGAQERVRAATGLGSLLPVAAGLLIGVGYLAVEPYLAGAPARPIPAEASALASEGRARARESKDEGEGGAAALPFSHQGVAEREGGDLRPTGMAGPLAQRASGAPRARFP